MGDGKILGIMWQAPNLAVVELGEEWKKIG